MPRVLVNRYGIKFVQKFLSKVNNENWPYLHTFSEKDTTTLSSRKIYPMSRWRKATKRGRICVPEEDSLLVDGKHELPSLLAVDKSLVVWPQQVPPPLTVIAL